MEPISILAAIGIASLISRICDRIEQLQAIQHGNGASKPGKASCIGAPEGRGAIQHQENSTLRLLYAKLRRQQEIIAERTGIIDPLLEGLNLLEAGEAQSAQTASTRQLMKDEDKNYSTPNVFDVDMPPVYSDARKALTQFLEDIVPAAGKYAPSHYSNAGEAPNRILENTPDVVRLPRPLDWELQRLVRDRRSRIPDENIELRIRCHDVQRQLNTGVEGVLDPIDPSTQHYCLANARIEEVAEEHTTQPPTSRNSSLPGQLCRIPFCYVLISLGVVLIGGSLSVGLYYSIAKDRMGDGFTTAGWMTAVGTLILAAPMAKHYPNCRCWHKRAPIIQS